MTGQHRIIATTLLFGLIFGLTSDAAGAQQNRLLEQAKEAMEKADPYMGDWQGTWNLDDAYDSGPLVAQVIALGKGEYRANFHAEFEYQWPPSFVLSGKLKGAAPQFSGRAEFSHVLDVESSISGGKFTGKFSGTSADGESISGKFTMEKVIRLSPTLGKRPPEEAIVLFDGTKESLNKWRAVRRNIKGFPWLLKDNAMEVKPRNGGIITKQKFGDCELHVEFRTPFMPDARGQGRGNSGVYLQGRYEVQILDSYGLEGKDNECGGIYKVKDGEPEVNMCAPPTQWQTYDITFRAPRFDANGEKEAPATLTVLHNGVKIQDNVKAEGPTTAAPIRTEKGPAGLYLQDHGNPVQFRNIWLVELPAINP